MAYRVIMSTPHLYRRWPAPRLKEMQSRVKGWALGEIHAGVTGTSAEDAWYEAALRLERDELEGVPTCGGATDIMKAFDHISRTLASELLELAGMPKGVPDAYRSYLKTSRCTIW